MKLHDLHEKYSHDPALKNTVLCRPWRICKEMPGTPLHRIMVPIEETDTVYDDDVICAAVPLGCSLVYADAVATIVSFDSCACARPVLLNNPNSLDFYDHDLVKRGSSDFAVYHRRRVMVTVAGDRFQNVAAWEKFYTSAIPEEFRVELSDPTATKI